MSLKESIVEDASLERFGELGYAIGHGPHIAPGEPAAERGSFGEVVLVGRLRDAIQRLNPANPFRTANHPAQIAFTEATEWGVESCEIITYSRK